MLVGKQHLANEKGRPLWPPLFTLLFELSLFTHLPVRAVSEPIVLDKVSEVSEIGEVPKTTRRAHACVTGCLYVRVRDCRRQKARGRWRR